MVFEKSDVATLKILLLSNCSIFPMSLPFPTTISKLCLLTSTTGTICCLTSNNPSRISRYLIGFSFSKYVSPSKMCGTLNHSMWLDKGDTTIALVVQIK